jgi:hypothetical protein
MIRRVFGVLLAALLAGAAPTPAPKATAGPAIAITINGVRLPLEPPPILYQRTLFVPVRRTIEALGLQFIRNGSHIDTQVGAKTVRMTIGSRVAMIDGEPVELDAAPVEVKDVLYAPLRFFTDVLGAQATFDRAHRQVQIVAQLVGRSASGMIVTHTSVERFGTVTAVDVDSNPPTITLEYNAEIHTQPIGQNAMIEMHDVAANVSVPGELGDIRPGDFTRIYMTREGHVDRVEDAFGSYTGRVAAATASEFVMTDGHVIEPDRTTLIVLDGRSASLADLIVGDLVTVRYNVETNEVRTILVSRAETHTAQPGAPAITDVAVDTNRPLRPGDSITVTMHATAGGAATFDIGSYVTNVAMASRGDGIYTGRYDIPKGANFSGVPIIGHLRVGNMNAPSVSAPQELSASSLPPGVSDFAPYEGSVVNTSSPAIYATFSADAVPVNPSSITLWVDGRDVTSESLRSASFIQYLPSYTYRSGPVRVTVRVADLAGNTTTRSWTFTIRR